MELVRDTFLDELAEIQGSLFSSTNKKRREFDVFIENCCFMRATFTKPTGVESRSKRGFPRILEVSHPR